jgi:hypothetical protein
MKYFTECQTELECKNAYRCLYLTHCKDAAIMAEINTELKDSLAAFAQFNTVKADIIPETTGDDKKQQIQQAAQFAKSLNTYVEITGLWVWVTGVKREDKDLHTKLHNYGFKYAPKKAAWYYHNMQGFRTRNHLNLEQIRIKYNGEATEQKLF